MKIKLFFAIIVSFALIGMGTSAFAAMVCITPTLGPSNAVQLGTSIAGNTALSKNVTMNYCGTDTPTAGYASSTWHSGGTKTFGTAYNTSVLYYNKNGTDDPGTDAITSTSNTWSGDWIAQ